MFSIEADIDRAERILSDLGRNQIPFAAALSLNDTAKDVKEAEEQELERSFDRPTPFTKRAFYVRRASKGRLEAQVGAKRIQAGYLKRGVTGGVRRPKGRAITVPVRQRLNKYGNMPRGAIRRATNKDKVFVASSSDPATRHLPPGVYQRMAKRRGKPGKLKMLAAFEPRASYSKRYDFQGVAQRRARQVFEGHFRKRLKAAIKTAR